MPAPINQKKNGRSTMVDMVERIISRTCSSSRSWNKAPVRQGTALLRSRNAWLNTRSEMRISARLPKQVHYVGTRFAQQKPNSTATRTPVENIQRWIRLGGDRPVIDLHGKDNPGERQDVNQKGSNHWPAGKGGCPLTPVRASSRAWSAKYSGLPDCPSAPTAGAAR